MSVDKKQLSKECCSEIFTHNRNFFTPEEQLKYKLFLTWEFPEDEIPTKVKESNKIIAEIIKKHESTI